MLCFQGSLHSITKYTLQENKYTLLIKSGLFKRYSLLHMLSSQLINSVVCVLFALATNHVCVCILLQCVGFLEVDCCQIIYHTVANSCNN